MQRSRSYSVAHALALALAFAAPPAELMASEAAAPGGDARQLVSMPEPAQKLLRQDMVEHLITLNQLLVHLGAAEYQQASKLAETRMGRSSMGKHRGTGMGPGRFMPPEMHQLGMGMHRAASEFATVALKEDAAAAYASLQQITRFCVACHVGFRIR